MSRAVFNMDMRQLERFFEIKNKEMAELLIEVCKAWAFKCFDKIVDNTPLDKGTLRESLAVDFNNRRMIYVISSNENGNTDVNELRTEIKWNDMVREGKLIIQFSANTEYAQLLHDGTNITFKEPNATDHYITRNIEEMFNELMTDINSAFSSFY
jgi:hypothetical protein